MILDCHEPWLHLPSTSGWPQAGERVKARATWDYRRLVTADSTAAHLRQVETQRLAAILDQDRQLLDALHTDDFLLCTPSGTVWTKQHYIDGLVDGSINYLRFQPTTPLEVIVDAQLAVVRYRSHIEISLDDAAPGHLECWHLDVYQRHGTDRWRCRWSQATDTVGD